MRKLALLIGTSLIADLILIGAKNYFVDGKDVLGKKKRKVKKTKVDWYGNVRLSNKDYQIV